MAQISDKSAFGEEETEPSPDTSNAKLLQLPRTRISGRDREKAIKWIEEYVYFAKDQERLTKLLAQLLADEREEAQKVTGETSDGFHTFDKLYEHRHALFAALCGLASLASSWKSLLHADGTMFDGWFIAGILTPKGMATYHLPIHLWAEFPASIVPRAPKWDGHTPSDVVERIKSMFKSS
jgi:hypothetical protein